MVYEPAPLRDSGILRRSSAIRDGWHAIKCCAGCVNSVVAAIQASFPDAAASRLSQSKRVLPTRQARGPAGLSALELCRLVAIVPPGLGRAARVTRFGGGAAEHVPIRKPVRGLVPM